MGLVPERWGGNNQPNYAVDIGELSISRLVGNRKYYFLPANKQGFEWGGALSTSLRSAFPGYAAVLLCEGCRMQYSTAVMTNERACSPEFQSQTDATQPNVCTGMYDQTLFSIPRAKARNRRNGYTALDPYISTSLLLIEYRAAQRTSKSISTAGALFSSLTAVLTIAAALQ